MRVTVSDAQHQLTKLAGPTATLRPAQWNAIDALVNDRRRVLLIQRTGFGKSAVYFTAASLLRHAGAGPTVIVSPLLALMRNQISAAQTAGISAITINSSNTHQWDDLSAAIIDNTIDVLLISPERLNNPDFRDAILPKLAHTCGMFVIDEAHCISDWGHDFRPDYRRIRTFLANLAPTVPVLATTATANNRVSTDIAAQLDQPTQPTLAIRGNLDRPSLHLAVVNTPHSHARVAWLDQHLASLTGSGIIYTLTVSDAHDIAAHLNERGHHVAAYTGHTDNADRVALENDLINNRLKALIATSALGMGFDKPDLGFVIHVGAPASPVAYYQQVGRAGRAVDRADVILLPSAEDRHVWDYFASLAFPPEVTVRRVLAALDTEVPCSTAALEPLVDIRRNRLDMMLKVLDVDGAVRRVRGGWVSTGAPWHYDQDRYASVDKARRREQQRMLDYAAATGCRMEFLRHELDDVDAIACGRCDNCLGVSPDTTINEVSLMAASASLGRPGVVIAARRMWPTGMSSVGVSLRGRIPAAGMARDGRALGRLNDIGWGQRLRELLAPGVGDGDIDESVLSAVVDVLAAWDWPDRPEVVVAVSSRSRPRLVTSMAARIAVLGRMRDGGQLRRVRDTSPRNVVGTNSARRLSQVYDAFGYSGDVAGRHVLLVDDVYDSGWTVTVAAGLLRAAGAVSVNPFVLAVV